MIMHTMHKIKKIKQKAHPLPKISHHQIEDEHFNCSALVQFSREISTISMQEELMKKQRLIDKMKQKQEDDFREIQMQSCKNTLFKIKVQLSKLSAERSISLNQKFSKLQKISKSFNISETVTPSSVSLKKGTLNRNNYFRKEENSKKMHTEPNYSAKDLSKLSKKTNKGRSQKNYKKFKAVILAVCFVKWLPRFSKKIMQKRQSLSNKLKQNKNKQFYLYKSIFPFKSNFLNIIQKSKAQTLSRPVSQDQKQSCKMTIFTLINSMKQINLKFNQLSQNSPTSIIYTFCKNGSILYNNFYSKEWLQRICISEMNGYISMNNKLQKCQIIHFLFLRLCLMGAVSSKIPQNMYMCLSIWYYLCVEVMQHYLLAVSKKQYPLGNWKRMKKKMKIQVADSWKVRLYSNSEEQDENDEIIKGLIDKQQIQAIFGVKTWKKAKIQLKNIVELIHDSIVSFHKKLINQIKF